MTKRLLLGIATAFPLLLGAQSSPFAEYASTVYAQHPAMPKGVLEAVSYVQTRMTHLDASEPSSCIGIPRAWGYLGLIADGEGYFRNNLSLVAQKSGLPKAAIMNEPGQELEAYARAFEAIATERTGSLQGTATAEALRNILLELSFIPATGSVNDFARNSELFEIFRFLNDPEKQQLYGFPAYAFDLRALFGDNYDVLASTKVLFTENGITTPAGQSFVAAAPTTKSAEYGPAIFNAAASCNYSSRGGTAVSAITIHTIQGTYAGAISWAQNCASSVSYHYVIRSSDGQVTQMVSEANKAWHVGSENPYTIGYEHEGYVTQSQWYTDAMYNASAALSRDIVASGYGIPALRTYYGAASSGTQVLGGCTKIKGHQHFPNQSHTDPGIYWNWEKYYRLINNNPNTTTYNAAGGSLYDSGGASASYTNDERRVWVIAPTGATLVSLAFSQFSVESGYDKLFIYDGATINAPLIGVYTGTGSPGTVTSSGGALTIEFRSDCATVGTGWAATWTSSTIDNYPPSTAVQSLSGAQTADFTVNFTDSDVGSGIAKRYARVSDRPNATAVWHGNSAFGYADESFDDGAAAWTEYVGDWSVVSQSYRFTDVAQSNSNAGMPVTQTSASEYLYHWKQTITSTGSNQRAGAHFFCDNVSLPNRGNSYFVYLREGSNLAQIYEVINDTWTLKAEETVAIAVNVTYDVKVTYNPATGLIRLFVDNAPIVDWTDPDPLTAGTGFSLRSGGCAVRYDDMSIYESRSTSLTLSVGSTALLRYESDNGAAAAKVRSFVLDNADNWSAAAENVYVIDWSGSLTLAEGTAEAPDPATAPATAAMTEAEEAPFIVYPQPADGTLNIRSAIEANEAVLTDAFGKIVLRIALEKGNTSVPTANLASGMYQLVISSSGSIYTQRVVIRHAD